MSSSFMSVFVDRLIQNAIASESQIKGCTQEEVVHLESLAKISFPECYKDFLYAMGKGAGKFFEGTDMFYQDLLELQGIDLLEEDDAFFDFPKDAFVFASHQSYQFLYFCTASGNPDPPVYLYSEGEEFPKKINPSFTQFLIRSLEDHEKVFSSKKS